MTTRLYLVHLLSPLQMGAGRATEGGKRPIARLPSSGIPMVPGSALQRVWRPAATGEAPVGGLVVGDAHLLALPVRSGRGVFAWVTAPVLLAWAHHCLPGGTGLPDLPTPGPQEVLVGHLSAAPVVEPATGMVHLEGVPGRAREDLLTAQWAEWLAPALATRGGSAWFAHRWVVVPDDRMARLWQTATQRDTRIRLDGDTRTVAKGAVWVEESLPPESLLLGGFSMEEIPPEGGDRSADGGMEGIWPVERMVQLGGRATIGRGRCRLLPLSNGGRSAVDGR